MLEEPTAAAGSGASKVCMAVVISSDLLQWCEVCGLPWSLRAVSIRVFLFSQARGTGCAWQLPPPLPPTTVRGCHTSTRVFWPYLPAVNAPIDLGFRILLPVACSLQSLDECLFKNANWFLGEQMAPTTIVSPKNPAPRETLTASLLSQAGSKAWRIPPCPLRGCKGALGSFDGSFVPTGINRIPEHREPLSEHISIPSSECDFLPLL